MTSHDEELLADLLVRWEDLREGGREPAVTELAGERPDLAPELARRIEILRSLDWLDEPLSDDVAITTTMTPTANHDRCPADAARIGRMTGVIGWLAVVAAAALLILRSSSDHEADGPAGDDMGVRERARQAFFHARYADAEAEYTLFLASRPDDHRALIERGICRLKLGRMDDAVADLSAVLRQRPEDPDALRQRAEALIFLGRHDEAVADLERLVATGRDAAGAQRRLAAVRRARDTTPAGGASQTGPATPATSGPAAAR